MELTLLRFFSNCNNEENQDHKFQLIISPELIDCQRNHSNSADEFEFNVFFEVVIKRLHENLSWNSNIAGFFDYHYSKCDDKEGFLKYLSYILPIMATKLPKSIIQPAQEIVKSKILFKEINKWYTEKIGSKFEKVNKETEFTRRRTVLALHFLQQVGKFPKSSQDATRYELFYQFLTGKKSEFRKLISNPFKRPIDEKTGKSAKELIKDIEVVRKQFHSIDFFKADEIIDNKLDELDRDKKDY